MIYLLSPFYSDYILCGICETASVMDKPLAPEVRSQFAQRLKEMRVQSGFLRARYFAKSLGIEENRYTRYERAEVEPSLTLIHKMCETLRVSPNELMGFAETGGLTLSRASPKARHAKAATAGDSSDAATWVCWPGALRPRPSRSARSTAQRQGIGRSARHDARDRQAVSDAAERSLRHGRRDCGRRGAQERWIRSARPTSPT